FFLFFFFLNDTKVVSSTGPERIVGGDNSVEGEWPWQVSLHFSGNLYCGASVLSSNWLISAAHCFSKFCLALRPCGASKGAAAQIVKPHTRFPSNTLLSLRA
uniref:Peptidase S1 domain-containing protein n=1 Tax=Seriola dumerili TaxID=41447 RepID=A0A3B4UMM3_SERDU